MLAKGRDGIAVFFAEGVSNLTVGVFRDIMVLVEGPERVRGSLPVKGVAMPVMIGAYSFRVRKVGPHLHAPA